MVLWSQGVHGGPFSRAHLLHQHLDFVELQDAFGPCQVLEVLPKCHQTCEDKKKLLQLIQKNHFCLHVGMTNAQSFFYRSRLNPR